VAERLSTLEPDNLPLARELAELYLQRNDQKRALAKLQICFKADNRDIDTLRLLGVAFQGLGQTSKTISVFKELARAYEEKGLGDEAEQVWQQVEQLDPNDGDAGLGTWICGDDALVRITDLNFPRQADGSPGKEFFARIMSYTDEIPDDGPEVVKVVMGPLLGF
jgi:tetratricopeptide (TPR) repeat protein